MKKNKDGSALIGTVIMFMFITTVSVAFLSMVTTNYYARAGESKRVENLYKSESGLDTTYNVIAKTITAANVYGKEKVEKLKKAVEDKDDEIDNDTPYDKLNELDNDDQKALYALYADIDYWKYYQGEENDTQETIDKEKKDKIAEDNELIYKLTNKVFKNGFKEFISNHLQTSINDSSYIEFKKEGNLLTQVTQQLDIDDSKVYIGTYPGKDPDDDTKAAINEAINNMLKPVPAQPEDKNKIDIDNKELQVENGYDADGEIQYNEYPLNFSLYNEENYNLTITSEFKTDSSNENTVKLGENLKVIEANYSIRVPNYDEVALKESVVNVDNTVNQMISSLAIGKDFEVNGVNQLNVNGNIFVQGNEFDDSIMDVDNRIPNKYSVGIKLNNKATSTQSIINFNDDVYSRGTFNIKENVNVSVNGELYAQNIYAGDGNSSSNNSKLTVNKDTVVDNDLVLKATNTTINLNKYYGINENNIEVEDTDMATKVRNSSSIIINDYTKDSQNEYGIKINDNAYIMGVAHINTENGYQTGESVAVKGNYKAYSVPDSSGTEKFEYYNPLQLLEVSDDIPDKVDTKADHFFNYWNNLDNKPLIDCGGVYLNPNNTYSIGAIVYNNRNKISNANYNSTIINDEINPKRRNYAKNVYKISKNNEYSEEQLYAFYTQQNLETVQNLLTKFNQKDESGKAINWDYKLVTKKNDGENFAMFCKSDTKKIVIKGEKFIEKDSDGNKIIDENNDIVISAETIKDVNAVIVTNGDVIINGDVNFRGNIISGGNLKMYGNSTVNLSYDEYITQEIQSDNKEIFNTVFGGEFGEEKPTEDVLNIQSNSSNFLKSKLWKIIQ